MASQIVTLQSSPNLRLAKAIAGGLPSELSQSPLLGILGVVMGAGIVTLTGRILTLGLADLKGSLGMGFDDGAWLGTAYNVALMFIGPFTVYIGGLLGPRRVLLAAALSFTLICAFLPLIHSYSLLVTALVLAGLTSGTFYPLTLTFALRNIPLRFLPFTLALYATSVDGAVNIAPSLYGWYRDHLSFHWMFWNSALITPLMIGCIYYGIPAAAPRKKTGPAPSFVGFLYASAGFAMLFAALDQGQRLDWWNSAVFNALFFGSAIFLLSSLARRLRMPNPLVDLPYLRQWNTLVLGTALIFFRFCLLATILLIPQSLSIHGFEANQIAPAVFWTAAPQLLIAVIAALLLLHGFDSRLLMATGFACMAAASLLNAQYTLAWSASNYYRSELLMGVGQSFAFIVVREQLHSNLLGLHVQQGNWINDAALKQLTAGLYAKSSGFPPATGRAIGLISARVRLQAYTLTFIDGFHLVAWACVAALLLIALLRKSPLNYRELSFPDGEAPAPLEEKT